MIVFPFQTVRCIFSPYRIGDESLGVEIASYGTTFGVQFIHNIHYYDNCIQIVLLYMP